MLVKTESKLWKNDMNKLLDIRIINNQTGKVYKLLGFRSRGDANGAIRLAGFTLLDPDTKQVLVVNDMVTGEKAYSIVTE